MDIIVVSGSLARARTFKVTRARLIAAGLLLLALVVALAMGINHLLLRYAVANQNPYVQALLEQSQAQESRRNQSYLRESLDMMATRLGEMQAQLLRLNTVGERVTKLAGLKPQDFVFEEVAARGGALVTVAPREMSMDELQRRIDGLARSMDDGADKFGVLESVLTEAYARQQLLPSALPVRSGAFSSNFGWRTDPFTSLNAFHEGIDFMAAEGAPILAAAGGVVVTSEYHPQYGNLVEIDHGNDLVTRYAHASKRLAKVGDVVQRGAKIAEVGSTGRSTGPHLHFEVRVRGQAQNPAKFLQPSG
ncbi:MAG: M23 family metallopeptidase [Burkholderiales bacterium]|nr:M23 family metallopeptidase [Burkholderiales bacterium]